VDHSEWAIVWTLKWGAMGIMPNEDMRSRSEIIGHIKGTLTMANDWQRSQPSHVLPQLVSKCAW
jgi:hypothetical protein